MDSKSFKTNLQLLKGIFEKVEKTVNENDKSLLQKTIDELAKHLNDTDNINIYKELLTEQFHVALLKALRTLVDRNEYKTISAIFKFLSSATEYSEEFSEALVREDLPDLLISTTIKYGDKTFTSQFHDPTTFDNIVYYNLHITYHVIRHVRFQQCFLLHPNICKFKQTILPWLSSKIINTRILVTFVLTWLLEEDNEDKYIIEKHSDIVQNVCEYIEEGLRTEEKYYRGYSLWELLKGIQALAYIDSIKTKIINVDGFIPSLVTIIKHESSDPKEVETSVGILWSLTFVKNNREILKSKYNIATVVEPLLQSKSGPIRRKVKGLLWELNKKPKVDKRKPSLAYDVFISYCHSDGKSIALLSKALKRHFKVWIDTDNMKGSGLSDMATGIEQSTIFIMAVSCSYKQSQCCRSEANWAFKLNKPLIPLIMTDKYSPDGWLGMMISTETYIDFSDPSNVDKVCEKVIDQVTRKCNEDNQAPDETPDGKYDHSESKTPGQVATDRPKPIPAPIKTVKEWNIHDINHWLAVNKLSHLQTKFVEFDGGMLLAMKNMMEKTYEKYNDHLEKKFKMSLTEILKFDSALSSLKVETT